MGVMIILQREFDSASYSTSEFYLRALNKKDGTVVWEHKMEEPPFGTPMSYSYDGKQYIVVATGGAGRDAKLIAYALPE